MKDQKKKKNNGQDHHQLVKKNKKHHETKHEEQETYDDASTKYEEEDKESNAIEDEHIISNLPFFEDTPEGNNEYDEDESWIGFIRKSARDAEATMQKHSVANWRGTQRRQQWRQSLTEFLHDESISEWCFGLIPALKAH